jgi:mRNA interferase MazF
MLMAMAGDIVVVDFPGAQGVKRRPTVVISSALYHQSRPDVILGVLTSKISTATGPTDYLLEDWQAAGLQKPSAFRSFFATLPRSSISAKIGEVSNRDRQAIEACVRSALIA